MSEKPRKRKDKKKKEDSDAGESTTPHPSGVQTMGPDDVQLHVHKDHGTGGHWCAKIVFFSLLAILAGLVGLIILENRGLSDVDTPLSESRFSDILEGWVEENRESHDDHEHDILASMEELEEHDEHGEPFEEEDDHDEEHDGEDDDEDHDHEDDDEDHDQEDDEENDGEEDDEDEQQVDADEDDNEAQDQEDDDDDQENNDDDQENDNEDEENDDEQDQDDDEDQNIDDGASEEIQNDAAYEEDEDDDEAADDEDDGNNNDDDEDDAKNNDDDDDDDAKNEDDDDYDNNGDDNDDNDNEDDNEDNDNQPDIDDDDNSPFEEPFTPNKSNPVPLTKTNDTPKTDKVTIADLEVQIEEMKIIFDEVSQKLGKPSFSELRDASQECPADSIPINDCKLDDDGSFEEVIDNDAGEDLHLQKLAQKDSPEPDDDDDLPASPSSSQIPPRSGAQSLRDDLQSAHDALEDNPRSALNTFERILKIAPQTPEALYGRAEALDRLSELQQSNAILRDAIEAYEAVLKLKTNIGDDLFTKVALRCINRIRFLGLHTRAISIHEALIRRFDDEPEYRNELAITHLFLNQLSEAKYVLHHTLLRWRDNPVALVHYGFVLKNLDQDYEGASIYLSEGIASNADGTQDGRFYFALGDSLLRLGRHEEARKVFRNGVERKLFLSEYQRSLYNVDTLKSKPFWTIDETKNRKLFETLERNWELIRDEGMKLLNQKGFFMDEAENLKDKGDWKQFDLFVKGQRITKHCQKAPITCNIMESFPAARFCTRGQIKFSVMHPGTHIWPHCGPTNCRIRAHLGLHVPPGTFIRVAEETKSWREGKMLIFDDSFEHEVWHNGTDVRLVLIVDIWHPDLTEAQRKSLQPI